MKNNQRGRYSAAPKKKNRTRKISLLITAQLVVIFLLSWLIFYMLNHVQSANDFKALSQQVSQAASAQTIPTSMPAPEATSPVTADAAGETTAVPTNETTTAPTEPQEKVLLAQYAELYDQNPELYGWIRIDGTVIDYPVMRSVEEPEKYLHANFQAAYSYAGTPFVDYQCSNDSDNMLIYGHNMLDGSMFRSLIKYENKNYWEAHPTIMYSDLYDEYEYEVVAAFYDRVYKKTEDVFKFYQFIDAENEDDFYTSVFHLKDKSLYDTGIDPQYGDQLITLITCAYHVENGRFVVVARRAAD